MMHRHTLATCTAALLLGGGAWAGQEQPPPAAGEENIDLGAILGAMGGQMPSGPQKEAGGQPPFEKVTEGMKSEEGLFTLWYYPPQAKDKDSEKLLAQIPKSFLGEKFMLSTSYAGGGFFTGFPIDERVVQWELLDDKLLLIEPETRFVVDRSAEVSDVVRRTYPERIRAAVSLVTRSPAGDPLIDLGRLLKSDFAGITQMMFFGPQGLGAGAINRDLSKWSKKKAFQLNVEIGVELAMSRPYPPGSYDKKMVHYSFWKLPKSNYKPRVADDRVGYFLTANQDWGKPTEARDLFNRYIDRWYLAKRDPKLDLCEPRQPIIFYIEKTVPVRYRRAVRDGILEWNRAFEKIGFSNAVVVRQQTKDNEWKDLDPEDMRYSFFRWIVTGAGFAMGPHRANPFTGQIYDADIVFDDSMVRYFEQSAERLLPDAVTAARMEDPALQAFLDANPQWRQPERPWERFTFADPHETAARDAVKQRMYRSGRHLCEYVGGMKHQMLLAHAMLAGKPREVQEQFLYDAIKEVVMHEVGHTLGLRHNFKASSIYSFEEIVERRKAGEATSGSVMDYNPVLFFADGSTEGAFLTPTIGPYDYWAIEYGYRPYDSGYKRTRREKAEEESAEEEAQDEEEPAEDAGPYGAAAMAAGLPDDFSVEDIPPDVLEKLPGHVRQMIESGAWKKMLAAAHGGGGMSPSGAEAAIDPPAPVTGEKGMLRDIAGRSTDPKLAYATDEDTTIFGPDPRTARFDVSDDPVAWARDRIELINKRLDKIREWAVEDEEAWYFLTNAFTTLMIEKALVLDEVGDYIGGQYFHRYHKDQTGAEPPFVLVEPAVQREALSFLESSLYTDDFFAVPPELLNHLAPHRWWHQGMTINFVMDYPMHELIQSLQSWSLFQRLFPNTLRRIYDAELKTEASNKLTAAEYIQRMQAACWGPTTDLSRYGEKRWTDAEPLVDDTRRSLQRSYLDLVEPLVRTPPGRVLPADLHSMVRFSLRRLSDRIDAVLGSGKIDFASQAHLTEARSRIERMLEPELEEYRRTGM